MNMRSICFICNLSTAVDYVTKYLHFGFCWHCSSLAKSHVRLTCLQKRLTI